LGVGGHLGFNKISFLTQASYGAEAKLDIQFGHNLMSYTSRVFQICIKIRDKMAAAAILFFEFPVFELLLPLCGPG
jgi:hypothetical protein